MLYILIIVGVFLIGITPYLAIKGKNAQNKKEFQKALVSIASIGIVAVVIGVIGLQFKHNDDPKNTPTKITWSLTESNVNNINKEKLKELLHYFQNQCDGWNKYPDAIESAEISIRKFEKSKYESYAQEELGWYTEVELSIKIKNDAKLPTELRMVPGHTLHYFIGGGKKPGILMIKDVSALFLGVPESSIKPSTNTFVENEAYRITDELVTDE